MRPRTILVSICFAIAFAAAPYASAQTTQRQPGGSVGAAEPGGDVTPPARTGTPGGGQTLPGVAIRQEGIAVSRSSSECTALGGEIEQTHTTMCDSMKVCHTVNADGSHHFACLK